MCACVRVSVYMRVCAAVLKLAERLSGGAEDGFTEAHRHSMRPGLIKAMRF